MPAAGTRFGEFVLRREIGRGAMGTVWEAHQSSLERTVALKVLAGATASDPIWVQRFKAEAGAVAKLSHPGILPVYGIGETDGQHWFAMELVDGHDFGQQLADSGPLSPREAAKVIQRAAEALQHAHEHGVIHRDVKPANLMVRKDGRVTLTDFGLAKHVGSGALTTTGLLIGTPYYMSPELVTARDTHAVGPAADVYGLGATLYELLVGTPPFDAPNPMALLKQIGEKDPKPPTQIDPKIPRDLETIVLTCLRKRPERRYASAQHLADDLQRFLDHQPIASRRPGPLERMGRFAQRNRVATAVTAAAVVLLTAAALVFTNALRSQEADYERRIQELLTQADALADEGDATAAETLYTEAEEVAATIPEVKHHVREARAGRTFTRLLRNGALDRDGHAGAAAWRNAPDGTVRIVTEPAGVVIKTHALRANGPEEDVDLPVDGGVLEPGLYRIELTAPGHVDSVVNLMAVPGMDVTIEVALPEADETTAGMVAHLGDWRPTRPPKGEPPRGVNVRRRSKAFLMDASATTNAEYGAFLAAQSDDVREGLTPATWSAEGPPPNRLERPVRGLTPAQGEAYATWRGKRLPSRREFEAAVVPDLVLGLAGMQRQIASLASGPPPSGAARLRPREGAAGSPRGRPGVPPGAPTAVLHLEQQEDGETIARLEVLREALRDTKDGAGAGGPVGPWTWGGRTRSVTLPSDRPGSRALDPGLRLVRDLE